LYLTKEEEDVLEGKRGPTLQKAMEILTALGDIYGADALVPIKSAQIAGVSYKTIGDAGLEWISDLEGVVAVPSILNPAGMDLQLWHEMGVDEEFARKQTKIIEAYQRLGIQCECTCTPYHLNKTLATFGDHLAWSESSAVCYANSVIGARTNREGGPSALSAALVGKTPNYGYHLDNNRVPSITVCVECMLKGADYGALGYLVGEQVGSGVPMFRLESRPSSIELKALGAAIAASGAVALYHVEGITPEAALYEGPEETIIIQRSQIDEIYHEECRVEPDLIALGCPHYSADELKEVAQLLDHQFTDKEVWIYTSRQVKDQNPELIGRIEATGAKVFADTCMVVSPVTEQFSCVITDSGKALKYVPNLCGVKTKISQLKNCLTGGHLY
jgi:predicted aconitase